MFAVDRMAALISDYTGALPRQSSGRGAGSQVGVEGTDTGGGTGD